MTLSPDELRRLERVWVRYRRHKWREALAGALHLSLWLLVLTLALWAAILFRFFFG